LAALVEEKPREVREAVRAVEHLLRVRVHGVIPREPRGLFDGDAHGLACGTRSGGGGGGGGGCGGRASEEGGDRARRDRRVSDHSVPSGRTRTVLGIGDDGLRDLRDDIARAARAHLEVREDTFANSDRGRERRARDVGLYVIFDSRHLESEYRYRINRARKQSRDLIRARKPGRSLKMADQRLGRVKNLRSGTFSPAQPIHVFVSPYATRRPRRSSPRASTPRRTPPSASPPAP
jgi:hypothetical protein